ncbi:MAG: hypothetical protein IVW57_09890 [Ktedonobacterales bacterium]|nr:hypothetical protein [Ktedonobacterales bacterium]
MREVEEAGKAVLRVVAAAIGLIGSVILLIVSIVISGKHALLSTTVPQSHGFIGFMAFVVGLVGALTTLFKPRAGALLMLVAAAGFIYVAGFGAILASPLLALAALIAYLDRPKTAAR